ncbi:hypothetical protein M405DRAFT_770942 [Rhizopogon salebrosus TDB-379]|nr:hypothetical protein M405DRAFT_770942 [Rhizopogon salebrosus TDB-379]
MALWPAKGLGVLFVGVTDDERDDESLESVFWNMSCSPVPETDRRFRSYGYQLAGNGGSQSMALKKSNQVGKDGKREVVVVRHGETEGSDEDDDAVIETQTTKHTEVQFHSCTAEHDIDPDDPTLTAPIPRYNAMPAVLRNTLYIYGGIFERGSRVYTLDDFYSIQLDKLERYTCLKHSGIVIPAEGDESNSDEDDDEEGESDDDDNSDDEKQVGEDDAGLKLEVPDEKESHEDEVVDQPKDVPHDGIHATVTAFIGVSKDSTRSAEDVLSAPEPGESLAMFYARSREYWTQRAHGVSDNRGKLLRRDGFSFAEERYAEYKPILKEVEKILAEACLDEDEMKACAAHAGMGGGVVTSPNRR